ncbi:MAG: Ig domain-containing protein, partial [Gemmatimonadaceae bacterium]
MPVSGAISGLVIPVTLEVPIGADRVFAVAAVDAANRPIFQGQSEPVTLVADKPATVGIQLSDTTIRIITSRLPDGTEDRSYTATFEAERGTGVIWTVQEGKLPQGLELNAATGALTGTSTAAGVFPIRIRVTDAVGLFDEVPVTIRINPAPLPPKITTTTVPDGTVGAPYRAILAAVDGTGAPTWSVVTGAGRLPDGLQLIEATGVITGTPTKEGTATLTVRATDTTPLSDEQVLTITINPAPVPPTITTTTLPDGTAQALYSAQLTATGGTGAVSWSVVTGKVPDGLQLIGATGAITGTPTKNGTFGFTVRATDTMPLSAEKALSITIKEAPKPPVITSTTLPGGQVGDAYNAQLTATSTNGAVTWSLVSGGDPAPGLKLQGATISGTPSTKGTFDF